MTKDRLIATSKNMVKEYYNRYIRPEDCNKLKANDIQIINFEDDENSYTILLTTPTIDESYYEVVYNKVNEQISSYIYKH